MLYDLTQVPDEKWYLDSKGIFTLNLLRGFDLKKRPIRVAPICIGDFKGGGVKIDEKGRTELKGLFAWRPADKESLIMWKSPIRWR